MTTPVRIHFWYKCSDNWWIQQIYNDIVNKTTYIMILAAIQTPREAVNKWCQETVDAMRQSVWVFEVGTNCLKRFQICFT